MLSLLVMFLWLLLNSLLLAFWILLERLAGRLEVVEEEEGWSHHHPVGYWAED